MSKRARQNGPIESDTFQQIIWTQIAIITIISVDRLSNGLNNNDDDDAVKCELENAAG